MYHDNEPVVYDTDYPPGYEREEFVKEMIHIKKVVRERCSYRNLTILYAIIAKRYYLEVPTRELDDSERKRHIVIAGSLEDLYENTIVMKLRSFASAIGWRIDRSVYDDLDELNLKCISEIRKKKLVVSLAVIILILVYLANKFIWKVI